MHTLTRILLLLALLPSAILASENQAVILMYHHFGDDEFPSTNVRLAQFEAHLEHLEKGGYQVWPLARVAEHIQQRKPFPTRVVAITVDDAYRSVYTQAYPRLRARGWPFTVFVASDGIDRHFQAYMDWAQMREMHANGVTFANHSASHDYLVRRRAGESESRWRERIRDDIQRGHRRLSEELGEPPMLFAYPYGEYDAALADLVAELGYVAFGQHSGAAGIGADTRALPRYPMAEKFAAIGDFREKVASLAWPIERVEPWNPLITGENKAPSLDITLGESDARLDQLRCYFFGEDLNVARVKKESRRFRVQAAVPLPVGRSRYNCTAPSSQTGRFYWYSHPWLRNP
jgi:peptidoglycan/xylan/chitin deacetylase (PgdA/CDA1 family)